MFSKSWATGRSKGNSSTGSSAYPGHRTTTTPIRGSVRAPGSGGNSSSFSRQEHLDSYLNDAVLGRSTMKVSTDDTTYDTVFSTVTGDTLIVRVHFPMIAFTPGASVRAPELKLTGVAATHEWLDGIGRVTGYAPCASDAAFRSSGLRLGEAVQAVVQELQLNPPAVTQFQDAHLKKLNQHRTAASSSNSSSRSSSGPTASATSMGSSSNSGMAPPSYDTLLSSTNSQQQPTQETFTPSSSSPGVELPTPPQDYAELQNLDRDALEELVRDDTLFQAFCNSLPITEEYRQIAAQHTEEAAELALQNLQEQAELQALHAETTQLQTQLQTLVTEFDPLDRQQDALQAQPEPKVLLRELQRGKKMAFDKSERLADDWLGQEEECAESMTSFCNEFLAERKIHHLRAAKMQILSG